MQGSSLLHFNTWQNQLWWSIWDLPY